MLKIKNLSSKELVEYYLENKDKYDGFILSYHIINIKNNIVN